MGVKDWIIRIVLAVVLAHGAGCVVVALMLAFVFLLFGGLDEYLSRQHPREERWLHELGISVMFCAEAAAVVASLLGVLLAPSRYSSREILRSWVFAALAGALAGGAFGAAISLLDTDSTSFGKVAILDFAIGALAGATIAIVLRFSLD